MRTGRIALILLASAGIAFGQSDPIQRALESIQERREAPPYIRHPKYVVFDRWPDHKPRTVFATLPNGMGSWEMVAFRAARNGSLTQLTEYGDEKDVRSVDLFDVTGDGKPDVLVRLPPGNRSAPVEILAWDGKEFDYLGETNDSASFVDLDHDGVPEIVTAGREGQNACDAVVVRAYVDELRHGEYRSERRPNLAAIDVVTKTTGSSETTTFSWFLPDDFSTTCRLRIVNGQRGGIHRAEALKIEMKSLEKGQQRSRGNVVRIPLGKGKEFVRSNIRLPSHCTMADVTLLGPAGATVALILETTHVDRD